MQEYSRLTLYYYDIYNTEFTVLFSLLNNVCMKSIPTWCREVNNLICTACKILLQLETYIGVYDSAWLMSMHMIDGCQSFDIDTKNLGIVTTVSIIAIYFCKLSGKTEFLKPFPTFFQSTFSCLKIRSHAHPLPAIHTPYSKHW